ncbi:MAG: response regulator [Pseudomonadota bacterium]
MSDIARILCVDDEPVNLVIMRELLQERFDLETAESGEECLKQVDQHRPDLILLDVNMPRVDGLDTCRNLRSNPDTTDIPIIFISALASHAELIAGYEAGGDDYITKPFSEDILQKKIDVVLNSQRQKVELKQISDDAVEALAVNLNNTEALAEVIRFLYQSHALKSFDELAEQVLNCLRKLDLEGSLLLVDQPENRIWFSDKIDRPMERQILESLRKQDHVVSFGTRVAVNSDNASLLVRKLPVDQERTQRLHRLLEILLEGLDVRIQALQTEYLLDQRQQTISRLLQSARENLDDFGTIQQSHRSRSGSIMSHMSTELKASLSTLELPSRKLDSLNQIIDATLAQTEELFEDDEQLMSTVQRFIDDLSQELKD